MEQLNIKSTSQSPEVQFDADKGRLIIKGNSILDDTAQFYAPLLRWIECYREFQNPQTSVEITLKYFNTPSAKCLIELLKKLEFLNSTTSTVNVSWYYEKNDVDMLASGEDFSAVINLPFKMIEISQIC